MLLSIKITASQQPLPDYYSQDIPTAHEHTTAQQEVAATL